MSSDHLSLKTVTSLGAVLGVAALLAGCGTQVQLGQERELETVPSASSQNQQVEGSPGADAGESADQGLEPAPPLTPPTQQEGDKAEGEDPAPESQENPRAAQSPDQGPPSENTGSDTDGPQDAFGEEGMFGQEGMFGESAFTDGTFMDGAFPDGGGPMDQRRWEDGGPRDLSLLEENFGSGAEGARGDPPNLPGSL